MAAAESPDPVSPKKPGPVRVYSEWFPRESGSIPVTLEVLQINGKTMKVNLFSKKKKKKNIKAKGQEGPGKL